MLNSLGVQVWTVFIAAYCVGLFGGLKIWKMIV